MLRLSVSTVDAYRFWREHEDAPVEELIAKLRGLKTPESRPMALGKAFHKALELSTIGVFDVLESDGFVFEFPCDVCLSLPELREVKAEKVYFVAGHYVEVVGVVDTLDGRSVEDHKTTAKFDAERFSDSYQWRLYLDMFDADVFRWNVFEIKDEGGALIEIRSFHPLTQYRYPGMGADVNAMLCEVLAFVESHAPDLLDEAA